MGTSSRKKTSKKLKEILSNYIDNSTHNFKVGQEKIACQEFTRKYLTSTRSSKGYFNPEKMSSILQGGFKGLNKFCQEHKNIIFSSEEELKEEIIDFMEDNDELLTEADELQRNAYIVAMTKALLSSEDKDKVFIENIIINTIKLGVISEMQESILELTNAPISFEKIKKEVENSVKSYLKDSIDELYRKTVAGEWKEIVKVIEDIKKKLKKVDNDV